MLDSVKTGRKIMDLRKSRGLTQEELAGRLNISPQAVSKWENGRAMPELSLLVELAEALGSTIDAIIFPEAARPATNANFEQILLPTHPSRTFQAGHGPEVWRTRPCSRRSSCSWGLRSTGTLWGGR